MRVDNRHLYDQLVGYRLRGSPMPPPPLPPHCPRCGGRLRFPISNAERRLDRAVYQCGGEYAFKDQIQNHTDYWWGSCPRAKLAYSVGLDPTVPDKMLDDALTEAGRADEIPDPSKRSKLDRTSGETVAVQRPKRKARQR